MHRLTNEKNKNRKQNYSFLLGQLHSSITLTKQNEKATENSFNYEKFSYVEARKIFFIRHNSSVENHHKDIS